uniref:Putative secreted protein n=1 Tax=Ixodes scapularis TaxID=6945 RepID=A0A4D5RXE2_IXOSC
MVWATFYRSFVLVLKRFVVLFPPGASGVLRVLSEFPFSYFMYLVQQYLGLLFVSCLKSRSCFFLKQKRKCESDDRFLPAKRRLCVCLFVFSLLHFVR